LGVVGASLLAVLVVSVLLAAVARRFDVSAPLALVVAGLAAGLIPGFRDVVEIDLDPELVLYVLLPPLLWSAGLESSYVALRKNLRPIGLLAVGLPLATTFAVGYVAYKTVPELTVAAALTLGAIVAPPDAVSATEAIHGSGVLAVVVAALILGQKSTRASYATRLQDTAVWKALQLILEIAYLL
jgi:NhaP-type Na+/H+ or K+/H+ antiporter